MTDRCPTPGWSAVWPLMREYIAAEIKLDRLRITRETLRTKAYHNYDVPATLKAYDDKIAEQEAQSTRMDTEIRRLLEGQ